jgi:CRP/FNR family transcriptional regulator, cyclic AMP receptor protein
VPNTQKDPSGFLSMLTPSAREWARAAGVEVTYKPNQTVFHQGEAADAVYVVETGSFEVRRYTRDGDVLTLRRFGPGEVFGELGMLSGDERTATVIATSKSTALVLHRTVFEHLRSLDHAVDAGLLAETAARLRRFTEETGDFLFLSAEGRLMKRLGQLADAYLTADGNQLAVPVTQEALARMTGVTRQTVNRVLSALEAEGVVQLGRGSIAVLDRVKLDKAE